MSTITIDERSALVLIDLQNGILALPTLVDPDDLRTDPAANVSRSLPGHRAASRRGQARVVS